MLTIMKVDNKDVPADITTVTTTASINYGNNATSAACTSNMSVSSKTMIQNFQFVLKNENINLISYQCITDDIEFKAKHNANLKLLTAKKRKLA